MQAETSGRILVVDDDALLRDLYATQLRAEGYEVKTAATGGEALALVRDWLPDIILLDLMMPEVDGLQICQQLKADPETRTVPVLMITAMDTTHHRWLGMEAGADDYLAKPVRAPELIMRVKSLVRLRQLYKQQAENQLLKVRYEASREMERLKDSFISILSHELHTPLAVLKGYLGLLKEVRGKPSAAEVLDEGIDDMSRSLGHLERLIRELLDYSRLRSGVFTLERREVEMRALLQNCAERHRGLAEEKGVELRLDLPDRPVPLRADPGQLERALGYLVENAVKFTPAGGWVELGCRDRGEAVLVRVRDTGVGIPEEALSRIFDPFYQASDYMTRRQGGMGLGLTTARHIISDHGGRIRARSEPGRGSRFTVRLPRTYRKARRFLADMRQRMKRLRRKRPREGG